MISKTIAFALALFMLVACAHAQTASPLRAAVQAEVEAGHLGGLPPGAVCDSGAPGYNSNRGWHYGNPCQPGYNCYASGNGPMTCGRW